MAVRTNIEFNAKDNSRAAVASLQRGLSGLERSVGSLTRGLFFAGGTAGFGLAIRRSIEFADTIGKTADKIGVGVEALQELRFAARRSGVEQAQLDKSLEMLTRRVGEASQGIGEGKRAFDQLGVGIKDVNGKLRPTEDILRDVSNGLKNVESPALKAALAAQIFGRAGVSMLNLVGDGSDKLDMYAAAARNLGVVLDESLIRNAEAANDKLGDLSQVLQIKFAAAVTENAGAIITLTDSLIGLANFLTEKGGIIAKGYRELFGTPNSSEQANRLRIEGQKLFGERRELEQMLREREAILAATPAEFGADPNRDATVLTIRSRIDALKAREIAIQEEIKRLTQGPDFSPAARPGVVDGDDEGAGGAASNRAAAELERRRRQRLRDNIRDRVSGREATEREIAAVFDQTRTALERYNIELERLEKLRSSGLDQDTYNRAVEQAKETYEAATESLQEMSAFAEQAARNIQDTLAQFLFDPFTEGLDGMLKGFADTLRRMAAEAASAAILESLFPAASGGLSGFLGGLFGRRASGGPVAAGRSYLVGERGPEVVTMGASGSVTPNSALGGTVVVNIDARQSDDPGRLLALVPVIQNQIEQGMALKMRRGYL